MVRQGAPDLLRCSGVGEKGAVGTTRGDFSRVGAGDRGSKSPAQVHRKADRRGLLCSVMAKVQLRTRPTNARMAGTQRSPGHSLCPLTLLRVSEKTSLPLM